MSETLNTTTPAEIARLLTKDANGLLPCEKCGGEGGIEKNTDNHAVVFCNNESCQQYYFDPPSIQQWNSNSYVPAIRALLGVIEQQREALKQLIQLADHIADARTVEIKQTIHPWIAQWKDALAASEGYAELGNEGGKA